jgi:hypothetical protein
MMPLVEWGVEYLPESVAEHLSFEPAKDEPDSDPDEPGEDRV